MSEENQQAPPPPPSAPPPPPPEGGGDSPPPPPPSAGTSPSSQSSNRTLMLILAYLPPFSLIPLLTEKEDADVQWHAKHGLVWFAAEIILWLVLGAVFTALAFTGIGCLFSILAPFIALGILGLHVVAMVKATKGERLLIPGLSDFADKF